MLSNDINPKLLLEKYSKELELVKDQAHDDLRKITTAQLIENASAFSNYITTYLQGQGVQLNEAITNSVGAGLGYTGNANVQGYDPIMMAMLLRAAPQMMAYDICGVHPMKAPTGMIFAFKARYTSQDSGLEALFNEADTDFSGIGTHVATDSVNNMFDGTWTTGTGMPTGSGELKGESGNAMPEMAFSIERLTVEAKSRKLAAGLTNEMIADLKAVHNMNAVAKITEILGRELEFEINRQVVRSLLEVAVLGCQNSNTATAGTFDCEVDGGGRNRVENFKGLMFQIEREANEIGKTVRRGKGNIVVASSDVCSALSMAKVLDVADNLPTGPGNVDPATKSYIGKLNGQYDLYVDPYLASGTVEFAMVGYKGADASDAGFFFCPYILGESYQAIDPQTMQPRLAMASRYALTANPFSPLTTAGSKTGLSANNNLYYRKFRVTSI